MQLNSWEYGWCHQLHNAHKFRISVWFYYRSYCVAPCVFGASRIEPLYYPAYLKRRLMEASRGLPAGAIPSVVKSKTQESPRTVRERARSSRNPERSSPWSTVFCIKYFQKTTRFILTVYCAIATFADVPWNNHTINQSCVNNKWCCFD